MPVPEAAPSQDAAGLCWALGRVDVPAASSVTRLVSLHDMEAELSRLVRPRQSRDVWLCATLDEAAAAAEAIGKRTQMCFLPRNLDYLRAGGRCSNAVALVGNLLHLHPCIDIIDGKLIAGKKYRGSMEKIIPALFRDMAAKHQLKKDHVYLIHTPYMDEAVKIAAEQALKEQGFAEFTWIKTGCVITCHGGAGAFGIVGVSEEA